jgi:Amj-like protein
VQCIGISAHAARLAGALSGRAATAISFFSLFSTVSRFANMMYAPLLGALTDLAFRTQVTHYESQLRIIVFGGFVGAAIGVMLLPSFVRLYVRGISAFERCGSIPKVLLRTLRPSAWRSIAGAFHFVSPRAIRSCSLQGIPKDVLVLNMIVTAVAGVGTIAAAYASLLDPLAARTALLSSGLVNGLAVIAYNVVVDPASAYFTDKAVRGERTIAEVRSLVAYLGLSAAAGFALSELLLTPFSAFLASVAHVIAHR